MKRGDIWLAELPVTNGHVQRGMRPVIIIQNDTGNQYSPTTIVCGITSVVKKYMPTHVFVSTSGGLRKQSFIECEQIFTIDKSDLKQYIGTIKNKHMLRELDRCIRLSLGLDNEEE